MESISDVQHLVKDLPNRDVQQVQYDALRAYLKTGKLELALGLQRKLSPDFQKYSLPEIAETSAKLGHITQALTLLRQVPEPQRRSQTFSSIIQKAIEVGNLDRAAIFTQQMPTSSNSDIPSKLWFQEGDRLCRGGAV